MLSLYLLIPFWRSDFESWAKKKGSKAPLITKPLTWLIESPFCRAVFNWEVNVEAYWDISNPRDKRY